jgi:hypothetical protein
MDRSAALYDQRLLAQKIASEKGEAQAICQKADGTLFTVDAAGAIQNDLRILEVLSGLPVGA